MQLRLYESQLCKQQLCIRLSESLYRNEGSSLDLKNAQILTNLLEQQLWKHNDQYLQSFELLGGLQIQ